METTAMTSHPASTDKSATRRHGVLLILCAVMPVMAIVSLVPVLPVLAQEFRDVPGATFLVPAALTIPALCVALFSPLAGLLADRFGRKWLLVAALLTYAGIGVLPWFLTSLIHIVLARVGLGIAEAVIMTVATTLIADYYQGERRERWIAVQVGVVSASAIILSAVGGFLGELLGSRGPFLLYLLAVPIAVLVGTILFEPKVAPKAGERAPLPLGAILPLLLLTLASGIFFYTAFVKLGPILQLSGAVAPATIGLIGAAVNGGVVAGAFIFNRLKRATGPVLLMIGLLIVAVGYGGMGLSNLVGVTAAFAVIAATGSGLLLPTMMKWILSLLPEPVRGRGTGLWTGMFFLGQFIAPIMASALEGPVNGLANVLLIWSAFALAGAVLAALSARRARSLTQG